MGFRVAPCSWQALPARSYLFNAARLAPGQVDAEFFRSAEDILIRIAQLDRATVAGEHLHVEAEGLHLLDQHLERLGDARFRDVLALNDGLVDLDPAEDVVRLNGQQFLEGVGRAIGFQRPDLHLTEPLPAELRLPAEGLLRDHRVRPGGPGVDLVIDEVQQLEDVDVADRDRVLERLAGPAIEQIGLSARADQPVPVPVGQRAAEQSGDLFLAGAIEDRCGHRGTRPRRIRADFAQPVLPVDVVAVDLPAGLGHPAEVRLQHLADVHPARHAERVEHDVHRRAVLKERHVLDRQDLRDDALVTVPASQLVTIGDLPLGRDVDPHQLVHAGRQLVAILPGEHPDTDDLAGLAVRHLECGVADLTRLLAEDRAQQPLLGSQLRLPLRGDLADQDVTGDHLGTDPDDATVVQVRQDLLRDVRYIPGDLLGAELGVARVHLVFLDVNRGENVVLDQPLGQDDRVLVVVALPRHERDQQVAAERHLTLVGTRAVRDDLALLDPLPFGDDRLLVEAGALVGPAELGHQVRAAGAVVVGYGDVVRAGLLDYARLLGDDHVTGVRGGAVLHTGAHQRCLAAQQRYRLPLHVRAHQGTVGVVVL